MDDIYASDGTVLELDSLAITFNNNGDGTVNYMQVSQSGVNYRQSFTYAAGLLTGVSNWVKQ